MIDSGDSGYQHSLILKYRAFSHVAGQLAYHPVDLYDLSRGDLFWIWR